MCRSPISCWHEVLKVTLRTKVWYQLASKEILSHRATVWLQWETHFSTAAQAWALTLQLLQVTMADDSLQQCRLLWALWANCTYFLLNSSPSMMTSYLSSKGLAGCKIPKSNKKKFRNPYCTTMLIMVKCFTVTDWFCAGRIKPLPVPETELLERSAEQLPQEQISVFSQL